jgi:hypothetical protein
MQKPQKTILLETIVIMSIHMEQLVGVFVIIKK